MAHSRRQELKSSLETAQENWRQLCNCRQKQTDFYWNCQKIT